MAIASSPLVNAAANKTATERSVKATESQTTKVDSLKTRANKEIDRRISTLTKLVTKVDKVKKLSDAQKTDIKTQIQANIDELKALKVKIAAETDLTALQADVKSIKDSYKIYLLFVPKIHLLSGANVATETVVKLEEVYTQLETKIAAAKAGGKDVASLESALADMKIELAEAKTNIKAVEDTVTPLQPSGYPDNKAVLQKARISLRNAHAAIVAARKDAKTIVNGLKESKSITTEAETTEE